MVVKISTDEGVTYTDITNYIAHNGFKWQRSDIDASNAGRDMEGKMHRARKATKIRLDITCRPLTAAEAQTLLTLIKEVWVKVKYTDPQLGTTATKWMYSNNNPAAYSHKGKNNVDYWIGIEFPLIEW